MRNIEELDPAKTVVVATGNAHKVTEIEAILGPVLEDMEFVALGELDDFPDPIEDGDTFAANALIKAEAALEETGGRRLGPLRRCARWGARHLLCPLGRRARKRRCEQHEARTCNERCAG